MVNHLSINRRSQIIGALVEGNSIRSVERMTNKFEKGTASVWPFSARVQFSCQPHRHFHFTDLMRLSPMRRRQEACVRMSTVRQAENSN